MVRGSVSLDLSPIGWNRLHPQIDHVQNCGHFFGRSYLRLVPETGGGDWNQKKRLREETVTGDRHRRWIPGTGERILETGYVRLETEYQITEIGDWRPREETKRDRDRRPRLTNGDSLQETRDRIWDARCRRDENGENREKRWERRD